MHSRHWILCRLFRWFYCKVQTKQKESETENKHWLHIHHLHIRLDKDLFSNYAEDKTWRSNNHFLSKQIKETLKLNELTCRQLLPLCILTVFVAKCTMNQIMLVDHSVVLLRCWWVSSLMSRYDCNSIVLVSASLSDTSHNTHPLLFQLQLSGLNIPALKATASLLALPKILCFLSLFIL